MIIDLKICTSGKTLHFIYHNQMKEILKNSYQSYYALKG